MNNPNKLLNGDDSRSRFYDTSLVDEGVIGINLNKKQDTVNIKLSLIRSIIIFTEQ